ncbi:MAG: DUF402 domain-containing protein [Anaerolineaceae bacterium]|nr:DUF402 domain-containing protein [Anaerolineaceae bacterium]
MHAAQNVLVIKKDQAGEETWRYSGTVLLRRENGVLLSARFNREDLLFHGILFAQDDLFIEAYFNDRWYNIFEIYDKRTNALKGWYCNIACPAEFSDGRIAYTDLALDLLVYPDGRQLVLDEDEFTALSLTPRAQQQALAALAELQKLFLPPVRFRLQEDGAGLFKPADSGSG